MTLHALASVRLSDDGWRLARSAAVADARFLLDHCDGTDRGLRQAADTFVASWSSAARFTGIWLEAAKHHRPTPIATTLTKDPDAPPLPAG